MEFCERDGAQPAHACLHVPEMSCQAAKDITDKTVITKNWWHKLQEWTRQSNNSPKFFLLCFVKCEEGIAEDLLT